MFPWSSSWAAEESLILLPGASPPLPSLALVSEGAVSLTITDSAFSQVLLRVFSPFLEYAIAGAPLVSLVGSSLASLFWSHMEEAVSDKETAPDLFS